MFAPHWRRCFSGTKGRPDHPPRHSYLAGARLDLAHGTVSISHTLEWRGGGWQFADTKRLQSRRVVKLQAWVVALLRGHFLTDQGISGDNLVFHAKRGGPTRESRFVQCHFKPLLKSAGLPAIRLYDLRHTAAWLRGSPQRSSASNSGMRALPLQLDVYSHVLPHMQDAAAEKVQALLFSATRDEGL